MIDIQPLQSKHLPEASDLFAKAFRRLRTTVPDLPVSFEDPAETNRRLEGMMAAGRALAALEAGRLVGYLAWYLVDNFRDGDRRGAYCPEWGHAALPGQTSRVYQALYRSAAIQWTEAGCGIHALTLLADDAEALQVWFWSGFGLLTVDAVRSLEAIGANPVSGFLLRQAQPEDAGCLAELEAEHWRHYAASPIFMTANWADGAEQLAAFIHNPDNSLWLALDGQRPAAYLRFTPHGKGSAAVINSEYGAHCIGAFTRPSYRGRGLAAALLDLAISHYALAGKKRMTVDFETINPEASAFWPRYFTPACYSLMRIPENL